MMKGLMKFFVIVGLTLSVSVGSFHAYTPVQELALAELQYSLYAGTMSYDILKKGYSLGGYTPQMLQEEVFDKGFMLEYLDQAKADGLVPQDYTPKGSSTPAPSKPKEEKPAHSHNYSKEEVTKEATCVEPGTLTNTCECGKTTTEEIPMTEHSYKEEVTKEASCTEAGTLTHTCETCGDTITEEIPITDHVSGGATVTKEATCVERGVTTVKCKYCDMVLEEVQTELEEHTKGEWVVSKKPTMLAEGEKTLPCTVCGEVLETETLAPNTSLLYVVIGSAFVIIVAIGIMILKKQKTTTDKS